MSDYHVKVKVRNGRIIRRMRACGYETLADLAREAGESYTRVVALACMREIPKCQDGEWKDFVLSVSSALKCEPEELFNEQQATVPLRCNTAETFMSSEQVAALTAGATGNLMEAAEARLTLQPLLAGLSEREVAIVSARAEGATLDECVDEWGVTRERIRQIESGAHRKMRGAVMRIDKGLPPWIDPTMRKSGTKP